MKSELVGCVFLLLVLKHAKCNSLNDSLLKTLSSILNKSSLFPDPNAEQFVIGIFLMNKSRVETSDLLTDWLISIKHQRRFGIQIMNKIPYSSKSISFGHTIIFVEGFDNNITDIMKPLLNKSTPWTSESRCIILITKVLTGTLVDSLRINIKSLWNDARILNFVLVFMVKSWKLPQVLSYNPFKDEIQNLTLSEHCSSQCFFPNKVANLYGYSLKTSYCFAPPLVYTKESKLTGVDYDFSTTFLKHINATYSAIRRNYYVDVKADVLAGRVDLTIIGIFLFTYGLEHVAYPHGILDIVALVEKAQPIAALASLMYMFDIYTWTCILAVLVTAFLFKSHTPNIFMLGSCRRQSNTGYKILILSFLLFNTLFSQIFLGWITTYLTYPHPGQEIHTLNDLVESKLPVYAYSTWKELLTSRLDDQYHYYKKKWLWVTPVDNGPKGAYVVTYEFEKALFKIPYGKKALQHLRQVEERLGAGYKIFYIGRKSPYKSILKTITLRALAYGFNSKEWGAHQSTSMETMPHARELQMNHLEGIFHYLLFGVILSTLVFIAELLWYHCNQLGHLF